MANDSRDVLFEILQRAVLEIRMYASDAHAHHKAVGVLTNLIHNLPSRLRVAASPEQHDQLLYETWDRCDDQGRRWLRELLVSEGFDPSVFPATDFRQR